MDNERKNVGEKHKWGLDHLKGKTKVKAGRKMKGGGREGGWRGVKKTKL